MRRAFLLSLFLGIILVCPNGFAQQGNEAELAKTIKIDSLLDTYSIEEMIKFRDYYSGQLEEIEKEKIALREKGIKDAEDFVANNAESKVLDRVLMRLAELYYERSNDKFLQELQRYDQQLEQLSRAGADSSLK